MGAKIRIKDIAERAGVSEGTVDRVLHGRPSVSPLARQKVERALEEMNYQPNMYASALAHNKTYHFALLLPKHTQEAYWEEIEEGANKAQEARSDFGINISFCYYDRFDRQSFLDKAKQCIATMPNGVVVVPTDLETTRNVTTLLHRQNIPFIFLDSNLPDLHPLSFFGQDSFSSGYFAAKMLMMLAKDQTEVMLMKQTKEGRVVSHQQMNREVGFRHYMQEHFPETKIVELDLPLKNTVAANDALMEAFFQAHPHLQHCITFNSRAYLVGDFLLRTNRRDIQIMGYDMVAKNAECLRKGSISFLIAQHAYQQGYSCIDTLFRAIVLKKAVHPVNYMPIELIMQENIDFYRRTQL